MSTAFLPWLLALADPDFTSSGVETGLPATSRMTSPAVRLAAAAAPSGSTPTMATPLSPAPARAGAVRSAAGRSPHGFIDGRAAFDIFDVAPDDPDVMQPRSPRAARAP